MGQGVFSFSSHPHPESDTEQLLVTLDQQSGMTGFRQLARSWSHLQNAKWINNVSPGTYDTVVRRLNEELVEYAKQLEGRLKKLDLSLKYPDNVSVAQEIIEKIEAIRELEHDFWR